MRGLLPEILVLFGIGTLLFESLWNQDRPARVHQSAWMLALGALLVSVWDFSQSALLFYGTYRIDLLSQSFKVIFLVCLFLVLISHRTSSSGLDKRSAEYFATLFSATLGMMMLASAVEILTLYISLELSAYSLYLLVPMRRGRWAAEAGIKYLIFGALASGLLLYGLSILMGLSQSITLAGMVQSGLSAGGPGTTSAYLLGLLLVFSALFFKLSVFPFHFWAPDVYEAAPTQVTAFIATASKAAAIVVMLRILSIAGLAGEFAVILGAFAFISMCLGNTAAILQRDLKRLLAYSSVAQGGYILVGILTGTAEGYAAVFFYAAGYALMNLAAFFVLIQLGRDQQTDNPGLDSLNGLHARSPLLALLLLVSLLSLAGIPPLVGFTGKWFIFAAAMREGHVILVLTGVLNSVISLYYYLIVIKHAYLAPSDRPNLITLCRTHRLTAWVLLLAIIGLGIYPTGLLNLAAGAF